MEIVVVGLSHKTAPVEIREKVAFDPSRIEQSLQELLALPAVSEGLIVSTCNRVELYAVCPQSDVGIYALRHYLADCHHLPFADLAPHLYDLSGEEAVRHLLRVASSLDSMVIGEPQILGQIKSAYGHACETKSTGPILNRLLHKTFSVAKRVRSETAIASHAVSISFAAVELARKVFESFAGRHVLLIGAGEMCELAARHFISHGVSEVSVINRTFSRAQKLADSFNASAVPFDHLETALARADIVLSSTGSPDYIVTEKMLREIARKRRYSPIFIIDIAVPRDIEPGVNSLNHVYLYDVDDLNGVVQANMLERQKEALQAEEIISAEVVQFTAWLASLEVKPTIVALRSHLQELSRQEVARTLAQIGSLGEADRQTIEERTSALINKILHHPTRILKQMSMDPDRRQYIDTVNTLFGLQGESGRS